MDDDDTDFLNILGYLYLQYGKIDEAKVIFRTLVEVAQHNAIVTMAYAYCLAYLGDYAIALHYLNRVAFLDLSLKERSGYHLLKSNIFWHLGRDREARFELEQFLAKEELRTQKNKLDKKIALSSASETQKMVAANSEHLWKRILRFIARKDLNREFGR